MTPLFLLVKCAYRVIELKQLSLPPGAYDIMCDDEGNYEEVQCTGSVCNCVNKEDGKTIENTEHARGSDIDCSRGENWHDTE